MNITNQQQIGGIGNYYGGLSVGEFENRFYWSIKNYDGEHWEEIPFSLYCELLAFEERSTK